MLDNKRSIIENQTLENKRSFIWISKHLLQIVKQWTIS